MLKRSFKWFSIIIIVQVSLLLALSLAAVYVNRHPRIITVDPVTCISDYAVYNGQEYYFDENIVPAESWTDVLTTDNIFLRSGGYTLYIEYETLADKMFALYDGTTTNAYLRNDTGYLRSENNIEMFKFRTVTDLDSFRICFKYQPYGFLKIRSISIASNNDFYKKGIFILFLLFLFLDLCYIKREALYKDRSVFLGLAGIVFITSLPLMLPSIADGHDIVFALLRIEGDYLELKSGSFPVRLESFCLRGYGYPISIYYGDIFLYFPAFLRMLGYSVVNAWKSYILFINILTAFLSYYSFSKMSGSKRNALILACAYSVSPYRLSNLYVRAACGEFTAMTFYPVIAMSLYKIYTEELTSEKIRKYSTCLAFGISAVLCSHILSTEMLAYTLVLLAIILLKRTLSHGIFRTLTLSLAKTLLLSAYFLIPFLDYYITMPSAISETVSGSTRVLQYMGSYIPDYFSLDHYIYAEGRVPFTPGLILIIGFIIALSTFFLNKSTGIIRFFTLMSFILLFVSSNLFPWDRLAARTSIGRILAQIQLPTRFIGLATIFLTCLLGQLLENGILKKHISLCMYTVFVFSLISTSLFTDNYERGRNIIPYTNTSSLDTLDVGGGEYVRAGTDLYADYTGMIHDNNNGYVYDMTKNGTSITMTCTNTSGTDHEIIVPRYNYKYYHIYDDNGQEYSIKDGINNLITFTLPAGYQGNVYLKYIEPWYWRLAELTSFVSLLLLIYVRRKYKSELNCI